MKNGFLIFLCLFLTSCVSGRDYTEQKFFIDSNIAADVYCDGRYIGTTPLELDTSLKCELKIEKEGYRPSSFRFQNLENYSSPKDEIAKHHSLGLALRSEGMKLFQLSVNSFAFSYATKAFQYLLEKERYHEIGPFISMSPIIFPLELIIDIPVLTFGGMLFVIEGVLEILALPVDIATIGTYASKNGSVSSENSSATSYNATSIDIVIPYDGDSFFFELLPKDKKTFNRQDLHELRTKLFVLKNFNELKIASPEYARTLATLTGKPFITPAPQDNPSDYFRTLGYQKKLQ